MKRLRNIEHQHPNIAKAFLISIIMLLGAYLRVQYLQKTDFIINDGGMFMTMINDLQNNGYAIPRFTSYNQSLIPFAYPPLSFYTSGFLNQYLHIDLISIFRYYPLFFNLFSIPVFYLFAKEFTGNYRLSLLATSYYAFIIPGFEWLISGGGLTRSPSHTFLLLSLWLFLMFLRSKNGWHLFLAITAGSLMILHHIEYSTILIYTLFIFSFGIVTFRENIKNMVIFVISLGVITSPYWINVISLHGISPFISALKTGEFDFLQSLLKVFLYFLTQDYYSSFINMLAVFGLFYCLVTKNYKLILWFVSILFLNPRSYPRLAIFPVSIFAAITIDKVMYPAFEKMQESTLFSRIRLFSDTLISKLSNGYIFIALSVLLPLLLSYIYTLQDHPVLKSLDPQVIQAMEWVKINTPKDSTFIVMDSTPIVWQRDQIGEWFPEISKRKNLTTVQGTEWLSNSEFFHRIIWYEELRDCMNIGEKCIENWATVHNVEFSHIMLKRGECYKKTPNCRNFFEKNLLSSTKLKSIFENSEIFVFEQIK